MAQESNAVGGGRQPDGTAAAANGTAAPTPTDIRAEIEHTRAEISETIDAIHARLSPSRVVADAGDMLKDATLGRMKRLARTTDASGKTVHSDRLIEVAKQHRLALALIATSGTAVLWRMLASPRKAQRNRIRSTAASRRPSAAGRHRIVRRRRGSADWWAGACTGVACLGAWTLRQSRAHRSGIERLDTRPS